LDASPKVQSQEFKEESGPLWAPDQSLGVFSRISIDQFYLITSIELDPYFHVFNAWWPFSFIFYFIFFSIDASYHRKEYYDRLSLCDLVQGDRTKKVGVIDSEYIVHKGIQTLGGRKTPRRKVILFSLFSQGGHSLWFLSICILLSIINIFLISSVIKYRRVD